MKVFSGLVLIALLLNACASTGLTPEHVSSPQIWGAATNVTQLKHLYFSEQPDDATLQVAKERGITTVISLRAANESDWDERGAVERHGLRFVNVPMSKSSTTLDASALEAVSEVVRQQNGAPVLLHCSSGNRAAAWLATHLVRDHAMQEEGALAVARRAGLTHQGTEERVRSFLRQNPR